MSIEKKHLVYTAADIKRYLAGGMNNAEMYALEQAALDDPFLTEAIEGYEAMGQKDWSKELAALKQKLAVVENAPLVPIYPSSFTKWWKVAAAVIVIGSSVAVAYFSTSNRIDKNENIATAKSVADSIVVAKTDTAINNAASAATPAEIAQNKNPAAGAIEIGDSAKHTLLANVAVAEKRNDDFVYTPSTATAGAESKDIAANKSKTEESQAMRDEAAGNNQQYDLNKSNNIPVLQDARKENNYKYQNNAGTKDFSARVVTADDKPVAFANVSVQKNNPPVYTDTNGNFKISAADSAVTVVVTSAGYTPQKFRLQQQAAQNKIVLQPNDIALNEVVVLKKKPAVKTELKREPEKTAPGKEDGAAPVGGWVAYHNYLNSNRVSPNEVLENNIHGEVEVMVKLKSNGNISHIKVVKTLCAGCDAEAIRLVKEGPKWEVKNNKASKVKVNIKF